MPATFILSAGKNKRIAGIILLALAVVIIASGTLRRDFFYPDEARIVYIARHLSPSGLLVMKFGGEAYYQKPPLYFWIISPFSRLSIGYAKISLVFLNVILALLLAFFNRRFLAKIDVQTARLSFWLVITAGVYFSMSVTIRMDMLYTLFLSLSLIIFYTAYERKRTALFAVSGILSFLACFTKGGFGFFIPFAAVLLFAGWRRQKYLWQGMAISFLTAAGLIVIWLAGFNLAEPGYLHRMLFIQTFQRAFAPFAHAQGKLYYLLFFWIGFLPWSPILLYYFRHLRGRQMSGWEMFYLCWLGGGILVLSLTQSKNIMYLLPLTIPAASLAAKEVAQWAEKKINIIYILFAVPFLILLAGGMYFIKSTAFYSAVFFAALVLCFFFYIAARRGRAFGYFLLSWGLVLSLALLLIMPAVSVRNGLRQTANLAEGAVSKGETVCVVQNNLLPLSLYLNRPVKLAGRSLASCRRPFLLVGRQKDKFPFPVLGKQGRFVLYYVK